VQRPSMVAEATAQGAATGVIDGREHGARTRRSIRLRKIEVPALAIFFKRFVQPFVSCTPLLFAGVPGSALTNASYSLR
jgi:hypothetical protein